MNSDAACDIWIADLLRALTALKPGGAAERRLVMETLGFTVPIDAEDALTDSSAVVRPPELPDQRAPMAAAGASRPIASDPAIPLECHSVLVEAPSIATEIPEWVRLAEPLQPEKASHASFRPTHIPLLVPGWGRSIAAAACAAVSSDGPIDIELLVDAAARQNAIVTVPRQVVPTVRHGVHLLVDRSDLMQPFLGDVTALTAQIVALLGADRVKPFRFDRCPTSGVGTGARTTWRQRYRPPNNGGAVIVLSDLGISAGTTGLAEWMEFAANVRAAGSPLIVFVPYPPQRWPSALAATLQIVPWDRSTTVSLARRIAAGDRLSSTPTTRLSATLPPSVEGAAGLIAMINDSRPRVVHLARLLSFAARIEPELIRAMRLSCMPGEDVSLEGDLWFSPLVHARDPIAMVLLPDVAAALQRELAMPSRRTDLEAAWRVVSKVHVGLSPELIWEEQTAFFALSGDAQRSVEANVGRVLNAMTTNAPTLARWVARSLPRLPEEFRTSDAGIALGQAASEQLKGAVVQGVPSLSEPVTSSWNRAALRALKTEAIGLRLQSNGLEVSHPPDARAAAVFRIQRTEPPLLEVSWPTDTGWRQRRETLTWSTTRVLSVPDGRIQRVRNLAGDELQFAFEVQGRPLTVRADPGPPADVVPPWKWDAEDLGWRVVWASGGDWADAKAPWNEQDAAVVRRLLIARQEALIARAVAARMTPDDWAIVVGIDRYQRLPQLQGPEQQAREFAAWLTAADGGRLRADRVSLLLSATVSAFDAAASQLVELHAKNGFAPAGRRLYIYAAGHGLSSTLDRPGLFGSEASYQLAGYHVPLRDYADWFRQAGLFEEIVLIADLTMLATPAVPTRVVPFARRIASGTPPRMFVAIAEGTRVGPFTAALLDGLRGAAANDSYEVTPAALQHYLHSRSRENGWQPSFVQLGDMVLAHAAPSLHGVRIVFDPRLHGTVARLLDGRLDELVSQTVTSTPWSVELRNGLYAIKVGSQTIGLRVSGETSVKVPWKGRTRRVLVAGTGRFELPDKLVWMSRALGEMLARNGHHLIVGGWPGVDHVVASEFASGVRSLGLNVNERLTQIVSSEREPDLSEGNIVRVPAGDAEFDEELERADAVVLIGGLGGTYRIFEDAVRRGLTVLPLPASGGDALTAFDVLAEQAKLGDDRLARTLTELAPAINNLDEARMLIQRVLVMLEALEDYAPD